MKEELKKVTIIIPVFNEETGLREFIPSLRNITSDFDIIFVDDGSTDATAHIIKEADYHVKRHPYNMGYGAAVKTGVRNSKSEYILIMDGDGQHTFEDLKGFLLD